MKRHNAVAEVNKVFVEGFSKFRAPRSIGLRLVGDCMRRTILDLRATEEDFIPADAAGMDNMSYGSAYEVWIGERLKNAGLLKYGGVLWKDMQVNVKAYEGNGYMDFLVTYQGEDVAVEVKTKGAHGWDEILKTRKPDKMHIYQLMIYMHFLKIKKGWLLYIDREKHFEAANGEFIPRWEIFEIDYDPVLAEKLDRRLQRLSKHKIEGTVPDKEPKSQSDPRCTYCSHNQFCWGKPRDNKNFRKSDFITRTSTISKARRRALFKASTD